jgi:hypothetical protein
VPNTRHGRHALDQELRETQLPIKGHLRCAVYKTLKLLLRHHELPRERLAIERGTRIDLDEYLNCS